MNSLRGVKEDLDYKVNIASAECAKWTDNTLQVLQYILSSQANLDNGDQELTLE
jgi:hypothetical protein